MVTNKVGCCAITWMFRPANPFTPQQRVAMVPQVLAEIRQAGYDGVELGVNIEEMGGIDAARKLFEEYELEPVRVGSKALLREGLAKLKALGIAYVMVGSPGRKGFPDGVPPADEFLKVSRELEEKARISFEEFGIPTALHNHLWTMAESREEIDRLFDGTRYLQLLLDIAHLKGANGDPIQAIRDYHDRIAGVHVKDWDSTRYSEDPFDPGFVELGKGNVGLNIPGCLTALQDVGYTGWLTVELDTSDDPLESNTYNRGYLRDLGY